MTSALVIGATGFVGGHAVQELLDHGYAVTALGRSADGDRVPADGKVDPVAVDRTDEGALADVAERVDPDVVVDCAAFRPADVRTATELFADASYVYVSSGAVYSVQEIPKREDDTPIHDCSPGEAADDSMATYPQRKAGADREVRAAAERGVAATSVRSTAVYGPAPASAGAPADEPPTWFDGDLPINETLHDYWIDRVDRYDRIVVPGDGTAIWHRAYVEDVARALRLVAEEGAPGEAYNVGDRTVCTLADVVDLVAAALDTTVEVVHAGRRELARVGLDPGDFVLYHHPMTGYPHVLDTCKLASLGWESTPVETAMERTVASARSRARDASPGGPDRAVEERLLDEIAG